MTEFSEGINEFIDSSVDELKGDVLEIAKDQIFQGLRNGVDAYNRNSPNRHALIIENDDRTNIVVKCGTRNVGVEVDYYQDKIYVKCGTENLYSLSVERKELGYKLIYKHNDPSKPEDDTIDNFCRDLLNPVLYPE